MTKIQLGPWFDAAVAIAAADPANSVILITRDGELANSEPRYVFAVMTDDAQAKKDALHCSRVQPPSLARGAVWDDDAGCLRLKPEARAVLAVNRALHTRLNELKASKAEAGKLDCAEVRIA